MTVFRSAESSFFSNLFSMTFNEVWSVSINWSKSISEVFFFLSLSHVFTTDWINRTYQFDWRNNRMKNKWKFRTRKRKWKNQFFFSFSVYRFFNESEVMNEISSNIFNCIEVLRFFEIAVASKNSDGEIKSTVFFHFFIWWSFFMKYVFFTNRRF